MAIATGTIAMIGLAVSVAGAGLSYYQGRQAANAQRKAADEAKAANARQASIQSAQAAQEQRQQIREERIRRAQIENNAALTGTQGSSGELGALGNLATNLSGNLGMNSAMIAAGQEITGFRQRQADYNTQAQSRSNMSSLWGSVSGIGSSVFQNAGGFKTMFSEANTAAPRTRPFELMGPPNLSRIG